MEGLYPPICEKGGLLQFRACIWSVWSHAPYLLDIACSFARRPSTLRLLLGGLYLPAASRGILWFILASSFTRHFVVLLASSYARHFVVVLACSFARHLVVCTCQQLGAAYCGYIACSLARRGRYTISPGFFCIIFGSGCVDSEGLIVVPQTGATPTHQIQPFHSTLSEHSLLWEAFGYIDTLLHLIFTRKGRRGRDPLQSISLRRKNFVQQQLLLQYIQIFRRGTRRISRSIPLVLDSGDAGPCDWKPGCTRAYLTIIKNCILFDSP